MISLEEKQQIILRHYHDGESQRKIHRETGISRKTIRKYIQKYEQAKNELLENNSGCHSELVADIMVMPQYDAARIQEPRADKYSTICVDNCHYSVPDIYVGEFIFTKIYTSQILCYHNGEKIAQHERKYGNNEWSIKIEHYLRTLKKSLVHLQEVPASSKLNQSYKKYTIIIIPERKRIHTTVGAYRGKRFISGN